MFNGLSNFLGNVFHGATQAVGGLVNAGARALAPQRPQQPQQQVQQRPQQIQRPAPPLNLGAFLNQQFNNVARTNPVIKSINGVARGISNTQIPGTSPYKGAPNITIGQTAQQIPQAANQVKNAVVNYEKKNPNFNTGKVVHNSADVRANLLNPNLAINQVAGNSFAGTSKFVGPIGTFIKTNTEKAVVKNIGKLFGKDAAKNVAPDVVTALKNTTNPNEIKGILQQSGHIPADVPKGTPAPIKVAQPEVPKAPISKPIVGTPLAPKLPTRGLTAGIKGSPNFSPELHKAVKGTYVPATDKAALTAHENFAQQPLDAQHAQAIQHLADTKAAITKQDVVNYGKTIQNLDAAGRTQEANAIHDLLAPKMTQNGQVGQAAHLLYSRTPEGLKNLAYRDLRNAKVELTDALKAKIQVHIDKLKGMPAGAAKDFETAKLQKTIASSLPQSKIGNAVSVWKAGLLSGTKTQGGNFVSNATFGGLKKISDLPATIADKGMTAIGKGLKSAGVVSKDNANVGFRTKTMTGKGIAPGAKEGVGTGVTTMKTGIDMRNAGDKFEQHAELNSKNPIIQKLIYGPSNIVFRGMSAADQPFWQAALKNSMYDQAKADGMNLGLKGKVLNAHMDKLVANPTEKLVLTSRAEANKSTLGYDTFASKAVQALHQGIDHFGEGSPAGKQAAHTLVDVLAPFTKVPTAFLSRTVDFTPLGPIKEVISQAAHKEFNQRSLAQAIGEGVTGTGVIAIGMTLANSGQLSGDYPKGNPKEIARWKAEGITANSVKIGGNWINLNYMGPLGLLFNAGQKMVEASKGGAGTATSAGAALAGLGQGLLGQSFLQGFSGFSDAIKDPTMNLSKYVRSQAASIVPNFVNDIANATDSMQRQSGSVGDAISAKIPGLRQGLTPKFDAFGNDLKQAAGSGINTAINPLKPSSSIDSPMLTELNRLGKTGKDNTVFPVPATNIGSGATMIKLSVAQQSDRQKQVGAALTPLWNQIINDPQYKALDDAHKKDALQRALTDVNSAVDRTMTAKLDPSKLLKPATGGTLAMLNGKATAQGYINKALGAGTDPASKYQARLATFNEAKKSGTLTAAKAFSTQQSLAKEAITSKYSQAVQDFYGLSKAAQSAMFAQDRAGTTDLYNQAKKLDGELVGSKFATSKYKNGLTIGGSRSTKGVRIAKQRSNASYKLGRLSTRMNKAKAVKIAKVSTPKSGSLKIAKVSGRKVGAGKKLTLTA